MKGFARLNLGLMIGFLLFLSGCAGVPVTKVDIQSFDVAKKGIKHDKAMNTVTGIFSDRGFDVKMVNKDVGLVTTEYKKFASVGGSPPFDYFMQIKARVKDENGTTKVQLIPLIKEQNRTNVAAFTEHELSFYTGDANNIRLIRSMREGTGWRNEAQTLFMNVVTETAQAFGMDVDQVIQNVTKTEMSAFLAK